LIPPALPFGLPPDEFAIVLKHTNCVFKNDIHDLALFVLCQLNRLGRLDSIEVFRDYYKTLEGPFRSLVTLSDHTQNYFSYKSTVETTVLHIDEVKFDERENYAVYSQKGCDKRLVFARPVIKKLYSAYGFLIGKDVSKWLLIYYFKDDRSYNYFSGGPWLRWPPAAHAVFSPEASGRLYDIIKEMQWFQ